MFSIVLVPTDLSAASDKVIDCLEGLRPLGTRKVVLFHALGIRHLESMEPDLRRFVEPRLEAQRLRAERLGFETTVAVAAGPPHREIHSAARAHHASVIVIGSQGEGITSEIRLGGVTLETLHRAVDPILVCRLRLSEGAQAEIMCAGTGHHILHPTDFSDAAERAFAYVRHLVEGGVHSVALLHVQDRARIGHNLEHRLAEFDEIDRGRLGRLEAELRSVGATDVTAEVVHGHPVLEILRRTEGGTGMLVVMGTQGRGFIPEVFLGSVSHQVARQAAVPVLLVPRRR